MFEKLFTKYARAVSDEGERRRLYNKYVAKNISEIVFVVLLAALFVALYYLGKQPENIVALAGVCALAVLWVGAGITALCLMIIFRAEFRDILNRPVCDGEMPEVASYRQKIVRDGKATGKKMLWAWIVFGVCMAGFVAFCSAEYAVNPDGEQMGILGTVGTIFLIVGLLTLLFAILFNTLSKQQAGKLIEQQTAPEAEAIDKAQGRKPTYSPQADTNAEINMRYTYLFPNENLRERADDIRRKRTKFLTVCIIILTVISFAAVISLLLFKLSGYAMPAILTLLLGGVIVLSYSTGGKLKSIEKQQKAEFESKPEYAKHLEWYNLNYNFTRLNSRIYITFIALSIVIGWVLGILFPRDGWSLLSLVPIMAYAFVNNKMIKEQRQKSLRLENEIDRQNSLRYNKFRVDTLADERSLEVYQSIYVKLEKDEIVCPDGGGDYSLFLGDGYISLDVDTESRRAGCLSGMFNLNSAILKRLSRPENYSAGILCYITEEPLERGSGCRIYFPKSSVYDADNDVLLLGEENGDAQWHKIFYNVYVQLSDEGALTSVLCTDICGKTADKVQSA